MIGWIGVFFVVTFAAMPGRLDNFLEVGNNVALIHKYMVIVVSYFALAALMSRKDKSARRCFGAVVMTLCVSMFYKMIISGGVLDSVYRDINLFFPVIGGLGMYQLFLEMRPRNRKLLWYAFFGLLIAIVFAGWLSVWFPALNELLGHKVEKIEKARLYTTWGGAIATGFVLLSLVGAGMLFLGESNAREKVFYKFALAFLVSSILLTGSRATFVAACSSLFGLVVFRPRELRRGVFPALLVLGVVVAILYSRSALVDRAFGLDIQGINWGDIARLESLRTALEAFVKTFCMGAGVGNLYLPYLRFENPAENILSTPYGYTLIEPHNSFAFLLAESGIVGFGLYMYAVAVFARRILFRLTGFGRSAVLAILASIFVHQLTGSHLVVNSKASLTMFCVLGASVAVVKRRQYSKLHARNQRLARA